MEKLISIVIPTYNGSKTILRAIESVKNQTYDNWEIILIDDGSTQDIAELIKNIGEPKIRYFYQKNGGGGKARNNGVSKAQGGYIALLDDDDYWADKSKLQKQMDFFDNNPEAVLIGVSKIDIVDEDELLISTYNYPLTDTQIREQMLFRNCFITSGVMFKKEKFDHVGGFSDLRLAEDYELWLRLGKIGQMANVETAVNYTLRKSSTGSQKKLQLVKNVFRMVIKNGNSYPGFYGAIFINAVKILYYAIFGFLPPYAIKSRIRKLFRI